MYRAAVIGIFASVAVIIAADATRRFVAHGFHRPAENELGRSRLAGLARIGVNAAGLACLAAVAITGFIPVFERQPSLSGYLLMVHVATAGGFAVASVAVAVLWVSRNQLAKKRWEESQNEAGPPATGHFAATLLRRLSFWIALAAAIPTLATALLAMFPVASLAQQQELLQIHRICALLLTAGGILFAYAALADNWNGRRS